LTSGRGQSFLHTWAPDNDRIAFAGQRDGVWNLYTVSRSTRAMTQVTFFKSSTGYVRYPAWSSTGSRIVFERARDRGELRDDLDLDIVVPALAGIVLHRLFILGEQPDAALIERALDQIILPAVRPQA